MKQAFYVFWIAGCLSLCFLATISHVQAQSIQIDGTTPTTPGTCTDSCTIEGGLQSGSNLFHSFSRFNVDPGATVLFLDPGVTNIISRVTGSDQSNILGKLGISGGNANLFLLNPNGIIFGPNASLNVGGSFVATTANAIQFGNQGFFSASATDVPPLLTVNPSALLFNQIATGRIENNSLAPAEREPSGSSVLGLRVPDGRSLLLLGGNVNLSGGRLNAFGGRVELGGLAEPGTVELIFDSSNPRLNFPDGVARADVSLTNGAIADVTGESDGSIAVYTRNLGISGQSSLLAGIGRRLGAPDRQAGDITLNATGVVTVANRSQVLNRVRLQATGDGGNISVTARELVLRDGSELSTSTFGRGNAGSIFLQSSDTVSLTLGSKILSNVNMEAIGNGGNVNVTARELVLRDGSELGANTFGRGNAGSIFLQSSDAIFLTSGSRIVSNVETEATGNGGNISVIVRELSLKDGSGLNANIFGQGNAGNIFVQAADTVSLASNSRIVSNVEQGAVGDGGEINIRARSLSLTNGAQLTTSVFREDEERGLPGGRGKGGNILVKASDSINLAGYSETTGLSSGLFTATEQGAIGPAGNITVNTGAFRIADGAIVNAQTLNNSDGGNIRIDAATFEAVSGGQIITNSGRIFSSALTFGNAGNIIVNAADRITLSGSDATFANRREQFRGQVQNEGANSGLFASTRSNSTGQGGNIAVSTRNLIVQDGAEVSVRSQGSGNAGNLDVTARSISLVEQGKLTATSTVGRGGGNIRLNGLDLLLLGNDSAISTNAGGDGNGGDIRINTDILAAVERSRITADASGRGNGGNIRITTQGLFLSPDSTISAESEQGIDGVVEINRPQTDPRTELVDLPAEIVDISTLIAQGCPGVGGNLARGSQFVVTGRGGVAPTPAEVTRSDAVLVDLGAPVQGVQDRASAAVPTKKSSSPESAPLVEANGWAIGDKGEVVLTASVASVTPEISRVKPTSCQGS